MINKDGNTYYIVNAKALPDIFIKTMEVKELLKKGEVTTIHDAVEQVGISRGAYYKYKDYIFPFYELSQGRIITFALILEHASGILSEVLNLIANSGGSILTINQNIPAHGVANVTISLETKSMNMNLEDLIFKIRKTQGVKEVNILGKE